MNNLKNVMTLALVALALTITLGACNQEKKNDTATNVSSKSSLNIRYIDEDSVLKNYNLAKDINEAMLRRQNQYDAAQKQRSNEINKFGNAMQQKYQNNQYLTEEAFNADQAKLQKMQADAENYLAGLQQSIANELNQSQIQLLDSIDNFMKEYAKKKGFDMVLRKSATLFIDEKYDVTKEVIEGLNKRYNKVGNKVAPAPAKTEAAPAPAVKPVADPKATGLSTEKPATPGKVDLKKN